MRHDELLRDLWAAQVPANGQSLTVQAELLRAVAKLEDKAVRNKNVNRDAGHHRLLDFLRRTLPAASALSGPRLAALSADLDLVADDAVPVTDDELWTRLHEAVGDWCVERPELIARDLDPTLRR